MFIAWRNLWRNPRRTWLTAGAIAFSIFLILFSRSTQLGGFDTMISNATAFMSGHIQVQQSQFKDDPVLRHLIADQNSLIDKVRTIDSVVGVTARLQTFALVSVGEKSAGALIMGVDPVTDVKMSTIASSIVSGRYLEQSRANSSEPVGEIIMGRLLAQNLGVKLGDEVVLLGSQKDSSVAAMVLNLVGIFESGQTELDRSLLQIPAASFREGFGLDDEAHILAINIDDIKAVDDVAEQLQSMFDEDLTVYTWQQLMPELQQTIDMKKSGTSLFFGMLVLMVTFSIVNTYIMTVVERTPEFGMLLAIGMKPWSLIRMLGFEAFFVGLLGVGLGLLVSGTLVAILSHVGIPLPAEAAEMMRAYHMPDRLYPGWSWASAFEAAWILLLATQLAAFFSTVKVRKLIPVEAMSGRA